MEKSKGNEVLTRLSMYYASVHYAGSVLKKLFDLEIGFEKIIKGGNNMQTKKYQNIIGSLKEQADYAKTNLKEHAQADKFNSLIAQAKAALEELKIDRENSIQVMRDEVEKLKPQPAKRKLDSESVMTSNFLAKTVLSRLAAEARSGIQFVEIVRELAKHEDPEMRQLFIDFFYDIDTIGEKFKDEFDDYTDVKHQIREAYQTAVNSLKDPEQLAYEEKSREVEKNIWNTRISYDGAESNLTGLISDFEFNLVALSGSSDKTFSYFS